MINPQAIEKRIDDIKDQQRNGSTESPTYLAGYRDGLEACLRNLDNITVAKLQEGRDYYEKTGNGGSLPYRQGIMDSYLEVARMIQHDQAREKRAAESDALHCTPNISKVSHAKLPTHWRKS